MSIAVDGVRVSGLLQVPSGARVCYVLAHGAGDGMSHPFMAALSDGLAERGIATLRYQFPYMEQGRNGRGKFKLSVGESSQEPSTECVRICSW